MSDTASTYTTTHKDGNNDTDDNHILERKMSQAVDEGHDADSPSSAGYVLDREGELKRLESIGNHKRRRASAVEEKQAADAEKGLPVGKTATNDEENDPNVVWWDGDDDPQNPYNWSTTRKVLNCGCVSFQTFISPLASCAQNSVTPSS